ncbi:MAG: nucleoside diphosphate kinase regulator [Proteobacteria bacterium]|uniref:nucleoside diphosphate kinase regulator n=1 Tax=Rudaea sp. TaxID=2136325 RepID=UPI0037849B0F|nr:nucleoside diphosphate kinase regulator [Pseudomonadota bacterium]
MTSAPSITVSSLDLGRLNDLLDSGKYAGLPGLDALRRELDRARVVEPTEVPPNVVTMNSVVRCLDEATNVTYELVLVYPHAAGTPGSVSVLAPVGSALLGLSVGQSIAWQVPGGRTLNLKVLEILRQPEAMGEFHR